jgi:hypothetical protein
MKWVKVAAEQLPLEGASHDDWQNVVYISQA